MACRILVAMGDLPRAAVLEGFLSMARNRNEEHEYRGRWDHVHGDGWGVVTGRSGRFTCYRSTSACREDPAFDGLYGTEMDFMMLHARRASPGIAVRHEFTHPFQHDGWYFCHNGMVYDFATGETSDSQQLFRSILDNLSRSGEMVEAVKATVSGLKYYSALNFIMLGSDHAYVLNMYGERGETTPKYYTMKYLQTEAYTIVSSERLPGLDHGWQELENGSLLTLALRDRSLDVCDLSGYQSSGMRDTSRRLK